MLAPAMAVLLITTLLREFNDVKCIVIGIHSYHGRPQVCVRGGGALVLPPEML